MKVKSFIVLKIYEYSSKDLFFRKEGVFLQETICNIEFEQDADEFIARLRTEMGGLREYTGRTFEEVLNLVMLELEEEFS